jgi:hypothetical protein
MNGIIEYGFSASIEPWKKKLCEQEATSHEVLKKKPRLSWVFLAHYDICGEYQLSRRN